ncbi:MAG: NADH-quinone oxidoreductase subunit N [Microthrixaceae bacterium]|nr:NADH-quinone oxidoreductase subunit N [Microthrixaceae bacterium]MCB1010229.1 NADH-quinone oxidoreductase subunit N [Microthrixaceae bacterium]MCB9387610.1 NADH-quinone oxidoreductase subunit N [Microthrixaceae bacterium]
MLALLAQASDVFTKPTVDYHALAPELILVGTIIVLALVDSWKLERARPVMSAIAGLGLLAALIPVITLAVDGTDRVLLDGGYVVDSMSLVLKALFIVSAYVVVLLSINYMAEGDYWESEYYTLLICSVLGMTVMASSRDLIGIFIALELLSIPAYMLAAWRKGDERSNEAGMKYYLMGVFATGILLYGMSLAYGLGGSTNLEAIGLQLADLGSDGVPVVALALLFTIIGFGFKVSAVPFHTWAPDTYEGAPTPVTAFLAVASKAAGFVALIQVTYFCFIVRSDVIEPIFFVLSISSMTVGNLIALRQSNVIRMLAYSGIAQAGFMLAPFAVASSDPALSLQAVVTYLVIYAAMNLGAFAVIIAIARRTRSAELEDLGGLFTYMPGLAVAFTLFLASLIGIPPLGGWWAKFGVFASLIEADSGLGWTLAIVMAVNTAIAAYYYLAVARAMWFDDVPEGTDTSPVRTPATLGFAVVITLIATLLFGILPQVVNDVTDFGLVALGG